MLKLLLQKLRNNEFQESHKAEIVNFLLESVGALPFKDIITYDLDETVMVKDRKLTSEQALQFREGAVNLGKNWFYRTIKEQMAFEAIKLGIHTGQTTEQLLFAKAVLWVQQRELELINKFNQ